MQRRLWLSLAMLATGAMLMAAAQLAGAAPERRGGVMRVGIAGASVEVDPQIAYITTAWWMEYATAAKLYNYRPGGKIVPEVASRFVVSNGGTRYTFFIRKGFRFSDGEPVTPYSFKYAVNRAANKELASPAEQFITQIVGVKDVNEGRAADVRGVRVRGNRLIIDLTHSDGNLLSVLTLPFFQATSTKLPLDREILRVDSMDDLPSAGPYAFTLNEVNRTTSLRRNPYWTRGPGRIAQRNLDGVDILWNLNEQAAFEMVERSELDQGPVPAGEAEGVVSRYGVNTARFWVRASPCVGLILFNSRSALLKGNRAMRKAINWALDRTDYLGQAAPYSAAPWTHILPPGVLGSITKPSLQPYSTRANIAKARELAVGHFKDGRITVYYRSSGTIGPAQAEVVKRDLVNLGFDPAKITMRGFPGGQIWLRMGEADLTVSLAYCHEFAPVGEFIPFGANARWFPDSSKYRNKIAMAKRADLGRLDLEITKNLAPFAIMNTFNDRFFFSNRVDPRSLRFHIVYPGWSIPALALK